ncbi:hypothetical protein Hanom_Chr03g00189481 [Helianthus anomalus]
MSRKIYQERLSDIFWRLHVADGLVQLQTPETKSMIRRRRAPNVVPSRANRACQSVVYEDPLPSDTDMKSLSADNLMQIILVDHVQRCRIVYKRRRGGCAVKASVDNPGMVTSPVVGGSTDDLAADPCVPDCGKVLHTPAEVMATYSQK